MGFFRKVAFGALCVALSACTLSGCGDGLESSSLPKPEPKGTIVPTVYNVEEIVDADETEAGSIDAWTKEVFSHDCCRARSCASNCRMEYSKCKI